MAALTDPITEHLAGPLHPKPLQVRRGGGYLAIFLVSFVVFLLIALVAQLLALRWRTWWPGAESGTSLIGSVKASVYTFMSYLT